VVGVCCRTEDPRTGSEIEDDLDTVRHTTLFSSHVSHGHLRSISLPTSCP
ncbi:hypothetical protein BaRGS_00035788, partial [Batillaria attramentaria]